MRNSVYSVESDGTTTPLMRRVAGVSLGGDTSYDMGLTDSGFYLTFYNDDPEIPAVIRPFHLRFTVSENEVRQLPQLDLEERLSIYRALGKQNPKYYQPVIDDTLEELGEIYSQRGLTQKAETAYRERLEHIRELHREKPSIYRWALESA